MRSVSGLAILLLSMAPATALAGYADLADLALSSPVVVRATIVRSEVVPAREAPGLAAGKARLLVSAQLTGVVISPAPLPANLSWLWDTPLDVRGKAPKLKNVDVLAFVAAPGPDGSTRLVGANGQRPFDATEDTTIRKIIAEAQSGKVPVFTGVANGFHADGTVPGESESQFFLTTAGGGTVTMVVTARPGEPRRVTVARGDIIDESAAPVKRDTLLWYRLACYLPRSLPAGGDPALAGDYQAALAALGLCGRTGN